MIRTTLFAAAALIALATGAPSAHAHMSWNGITLNGITLNGISINGVYLNGIDSDVVPASVQSITLPSGVTLAAA